MAGIFLGKTGCGTLEEMKLTDIGDFSSVHLWTTCHDG
jgi:hypothetical protein